MKLSLGFAFAILLTLQSLQVQRLQSAEIPESLSNTTDTSASEDTFSGEDEYLSSKQPPSESGQDKDESLLNPNSFNSSTESLDTSDDTNKTLIEKGNMSDSVVPTPRPSTSNETSLNDTDTLQPEISSTRPQPGSLPSNKTATDTFEGTQSSSSTADKWIMTTSHMSSVPKTTKAQSEGTSKGTSPRMTTMSPTTNMRTDKLPDTVRPESTAMPSTKSNMTGESFEVRGGSERGHSSDIQYNTNNHAWGAIVGIAVVVGLTALAVFVIAKWKNHRDFSHRKLVEDTPGDPVLRLDNSEPLDLKFDGFAYYNPGLQGDNIQMTNFPQGHFN